MEHHHRPRGGGSKLHHNGGGGKAAPPTRRKKGPQEVGRVLLPFSFPFQFVGVQLFFLSSFWVVLRSSLSFCGRCCFGWSCCPILLWCGVVLLFHLGWCCLLFPPPLQGKARQGKVRYGKSWFALLLLGGAAFRLLFFVAVLVSHPPSFA